MYYPKCFYSYEQYREWVTLAKQAKENVSPCDDCSVRYELKMREAGMCDRQWITKNLIIGRKSLSHGMFE